MVTEWYARDSAPDSDRQSAAGIPASDSPSDYSQYSEGDTFASLKKKIEVLIDRHPRYIVFLDENLDVQWESSDAGRGYQPGIEHILNRVSDVESRPTGHLKRGVKGAYGRMVGEAVARVLGDKSPEAANEALDTAIAYLNARNAEASRLWQMEASLAIVVVALAAGIAAWTFRAQLISSLGPGALEVVLGTVAGAMGGLVSVTLRMGGERFDAGAGPRLHYLEAASRMGVSMIGGCLTVLAMQANLVLSSFYNGPNRFAALLAAAIASGWSERFVPALIGQIESEIGGTGSKQPTSPNNKPRTGTAVPGQSGRESGAPTAEQDDTDRRA